MRLWFTFRKGIRLHIVNRQGRRLILRIDRLSIALVLLICISIFTIKGIVCMINHTPDTNTEICIKEETPMLDTNTTTYEVQQEQETETTFQEVKQEPKRLDYRMTYYYPGDSTNSGNTTASGKSIKDFKVNENGWFTYNGKLVVATASKRLLTWTQYSNSKQKMYNLYDELTLNIQGKLYEAIVLDVCGACMRDEKIDLYVKDRKSGLDTSIQVVKINENYIYE